MNKFLFSSFTSFRKEKLDKTLYATFLFSFLFLGILFSYIPVTTIYSDTIDPFNLGFLGIILSFLTNLIFLSSIIFLGLLIFRKRKYFIIYLIVFSFIISVFCYVMVSYNKYYNTLLSRENLCLVKNPADDMAHDIGISYLRNLYFKNEFLIGIYFLIIFILGVVLLVNKGISKTRITGKKAFFILFILSKIFVLSSAGIAIVNLDKLWGLDTCGPEFIADHSGVYTAYTYGALFRKKHVKKLNKNASLKAFNKNKDTYTNIFGETFHKTLNINDAVGILDETRLNPMFKDKNLNGIFKDRTLIYVEMESLNHYLLGEEESSILNRIDVLPTLKWLINESYYLPNMYDNAGIAHTSDGAFSMLTGYIPRGDDVIYWKHADRNYSYPSALPKLFNEVGYRTIEVEAGNKLFYNKENVVKRLYQYTDYYYYDESEKNEHNLYYQKNKYTTDIFGNAQSHLYGKLNDQIMIKILEDLYQKHKTEKLFIRPVTMLPHAPFLEVKKAMNFKNEHMLDIETKNLIESVNYIDDFFKGFIELGKRLENPVFIFCSDHGATGVPKKDVEVILGKDLTQLEFRREIKRLISFIYVPDSEGKGLLKGRNDRVRSQIDIYRTIVELFGLNPITEYYGVNLFSNEKTIAIDPKGLNLFADDFMLLGKSQIFNFGRHDYVSSLSKEETQKYFSLIKKFKLNSDMILNYDLFKNIYLV